MVERKPINDRQKRINEREAQKAAYEAQVQAYVQEELKKREKRRRAIIALCGILGAACLLYVGFYGYEDYRTRRSYEEMAGLKGEETGQSINQAFGNDAPTINYTKDDKTVPEVLDEYKKLYNTNKKLIGWLKIDDTNINYPVMQTNNNEYYLNHNMNQEKDRNGALFLDKDCDVINRSTNLIIYGHHMKSGRMFGNLDDYESKEYYKKHPIIEFDTIYEKGTYEIMYVFRSRVYKEGDVVFKYYQFIDCYSEQEFESNMQEMESLSLYDTGVKAEYGDRLLTLSTCDNTVDDGRFVVVAKKIK
ncbi:MAG: class B sortase [Lachnospiraceae bacterium]|nr:class B sortase [Lachnospiraceae bacterium]